MFNDTLFFLEQAKSFDSSHENDWLRWRYLRASIIYSYSSLESYVNLLIADTLRNVYGLNQAAEDFQNDRSARLYNKIDKIYPSIIGKVVEPNWSITSDFGAVNEIRNRLSHFKGGTSIYNDSDKYGINIANAEKSVNMVRAVIKMLHRLSNERFPLWVDQIASMIIH
jgi:hypothetical protein